MTTPAPKSWPIEYAARLFRVCRGEHVLAGDWEQTTLGEVENLIVTEDFDSFLIANKIRAL